MPQYLTAINPQKHTQIKDGYGSETSLAVGEWEFVF